MATTKEVEKGHEKEDLLFDGYVKPYQPGKKTDCCTCTKKKAIIIAIVVVMLLLYALGLGIGLAIGLKGRKKEKELENNSMPSSSQSTLVPEELKTAKGVVVTDHEDCSHVGMAILSQGGSAVDAAIAALLCNGVRQPHSMGIGGGCFIVIYDKENRKAITIDGRETAPKAATQQIISDTPGIFDPSNKGGWLAAGVPTDHERSKTIGIPGELRAYKAAHDMYGHLPWRHLFTSAIIMAENHTLSESTARALTFGEKRGYKLANNPRLCEIFCDENKEPKKAGDYIQWPKLAHTLRKISEEGPDYLYDGDATYDIREEMKVDKGLLNYEDFRYSKVKTEAAMEFEFAGMKLYTLGPPSGGPVLGFIAKLLDGLNLNGEDLSTDEKTAETYHKIIEAFKFAYASREHLADPDYVDVSEALANMTSQDFIDHIRSRINVTHTQQPSYYTNITTAAQESFGTSHISVLSPYGDAVSVTSTINYYFGSQIVSNATGIIWNNEMIDFTLSRGANKNYNGINKVEAGKRPLSSMCPALVVDKNGQVRYVLGAAGGSYITTITAEVLARMVWLKQGLRDAITAKRFHHALKPDVLKYESGFPKEVLEKLQSMGHDKVEERSSYIAVVEGISVSSDGRIEGYADPRKQPGRASYVYE